MGSLVVGILEEGNPAAVGALGLVVDSRIVVVVGRSGLVVAVGRDRRDWRLGGQGVDMQGSPGWC